MHDRSDVLIVCACADGAHLKGHGDQTLRGAAEKPALTNASWVTGPGRGYFHQVPYETAQERFSRFSLTGPSAQVPCSCRMANGAAKTARDWCTDVQRTRPGCCSPEMEKWWAARPHLQMPEAVRAGIEAFKAIEGARAATVASESSLLEITDMDDEDVVQDVLVQTHASINATLSRQRRAHDHAPRAAATAPTAGPSTGDEAAGGEDSTSPGGGDVGSTSHGEPLTARAAGGPRTGRTNFKVTSGRFKGWKTQDMIAEARRICQQNRETVLRLCLSSNIPNSMTKKTVWEWLTTYDQGCEQEAGSSL